MPQDEQVDPSSSSTAGDEEQHQREDDGDDAMRRSLHDAADASPSTTTTEATSSGSPAGLKQANHHQDASAALPSILENSSGYHVYTIQSFLERFVPTLSRILISDELLSMWKDLLLVVRTEDSLQQLTKFSVQNRESHASLLQDCIGFLVKERTKTKHSSYQTPTNLLSAGFSLREGGSTTVHQRQLNAAVDYLRTAPALVNLHEAVGDDVTRYILLNTCLFLKVHSNSEPDNNNNYWQLTGAPVTALSLKKQEQKVVHKKKTKRRKRRRPIQQLQDVKHLAPDQCVSRVGLFYSAQYTVKVGDKLLQQYSAESNKSLWASMMQEYAAVFEDAPKSIAAEEPPWCGELLKRHKRIDYPRLLEHYCPLLEKYQELLLAELTQQYSTSVLSFARACFSRLLPGAQFWGSDHNQTIFLQHTLASFVQLRRQERFPNKLLLKDLCITQMSWLLSPKREKKCSRIDHERAKLLLLSVLRWILRDYLIPLLSECFYVSEAEFGGLQVFFYRKPVWSRYRNLAMQRLLTKQYTELTEHEVTARLSQQEMGLSGLRLLPKTNGVRPIATLRQREVLMLPIGTNFATTGQDDDDDGDDAPLVDAPAGPARKRYKNGSGIGTNVPRPPRVPAPNQSRRSTNAMLGDCFDVLSFEHNRQEQAFGAGLMGLHHFHSKYRQFMCQWKENVQDDKPLYFGSVDILHCYDNIQQEHLLGIVENILQEDEYVIQKYSVLHPTDGDRVRHRRCKDVSPPEEMEPFGETVRVLDAKHKDCVFVDGVHSVAISKRQVVDQVREHLTSHLVVTKGRYGKRYLLQSQGIPQGSILSSLLCIFYYGNVEQRLQLPFSDDALLARMVDDFLMVTTDLSKLQCFFAKMHHGDPALGVTINQEKTCSSITVEILTVDDDTEVKIIPSSSCRLFPWCGMLFDSSTGEVRNDYSRFAAIKGRDSLTVQLVSQEGDHLLRQMKLFVRPRCLPILFDPSINSLPTQVTNFYQLLLFAAVKTAEYLSSIASSTHRRNDGKNRCAFPNNRFLTSGIETTIKHSHSLIQGRLRKSYKEMHVEEHQLRNLLKFEMALWLGWQAFHDVFRQLHQDLRGLAKQHLLPLADASFDRSTEADGDRRDLWKRTVSLALRDFDLPTLIDVQKKQSERHRLRRNHAQKLGNVEAIAQRVYANSQCKLNL